MCLNPKQARKDRADREAIVASLEEQLKRGDKSLVGNRGYRRYIKSEKDVFSIVRAVEPLIAALRDENSSVRAGAATGLGHHCANLN